MKKLQRSKTQGLRNVLLFNWPYYAFSGVVIAACTAAGVWSGSWIALSAAGAAFYYAAASLAASHYIYDRSDLYGLTWLLRLNPGPGPAANVTAGFDETSSLLREALRDSIDSYDFFNPKENTEPSIARARAEHPASAYLLSEGLRARYQNIFLLLSAHEMRTEEARSRLFAQLRAGLADGGQIILVEHLRNLANFLVYGPGFFHFHSDHTWRSSIHKSGASLKTDFAITPFLRCYVIQ